MRFSGYRLLFVVLTPLLLFIIRPRKNNMVGSKTDIVLSGSQFEGGGGLIRDFIAYACIFDISIRFYNIRAFRPGAGGLRVEHTVAVEKWQN